MQAQHTWDLYMKALMCLPALLHIRRQPENRIQLLMDCQSPEVHDISTLISVLIRYMLLNPGCLSGEAMPLKVASLGSSKHYDLKHQKNCLLTLRSLWGRCVPHDLLSGRTRGSWTWLWAWYYAGAWAASHAR